MHLTELHDVLKHLTFDAPYWDDAFLVMSPFPRVETCWKNPELAGTWVFAFSTTRECAHQLIGPGLFVIAPQLHRVSAVYRQSKYAKEMLYEMKRFG